MSNARIFLFLRQGGGDENFRNVFVIKNFYHLSSTYLKRFFGYDKKNCEEARKGFTFTPQDTAEKLDEIRKNCRYSP